MFTGNMYIVHLNFDLHVYSCIDPSALWQAFITYKYLTQIHKLFIVYSIIDCRT